MAIQDDNTIVTKGDLKALYTDKIAPYLGGNFMMSTNVSDSYSTDEKIIGVWVDGRPIYQKTVEITVPSGINSTANATIPDMDIAINVFGTYLANNGGSGDQDYWMITRHYDNNSTSNTYNCNAWANGRMTTNNVSFRNFNQRAKVGSTAYVTVQYTKTTDVAGSGVTTPGAYDINFPYTWPVDKEIYFGNGVYGKRNVRTTTTATNTQYVIQTGVSKIVNCGGTQWRTGDGYGHPMAVFPADTAYPYFYIKGATMSGGTGELSIWGATVAMQGWDVWATYTK